VKDGGASKPRVQIVGYISTSDELHLGSRDQRSERCTAAPAKTLEVR
jgi:hypothetical protein